MASLDRISNAKNENSSSESSPLLVTNSSESTLITHHQHHQQYATAGSGTTPSPQYDVNNNATAAGGYFVPPTVHHPQTGRYSQQQQQNSIITHSPNQPPSQVISANTGTMTGMVSSQSQPPFFYPFPPPIQNGNPTPNPYYPYPSPHHQQQWQQQWQQQSQSASSSPQSSRMELQGNTSDSNGARRAIDNKITTANMNSSTSSGLPPLDDIFGGYGSTSSSPIIYNAPLQPRRLPPSGRVSHQVVPLKGVGTSNGTGQKNHRRVHSDNPLKVSRAHRRAGSGELLLPPKHNRSRTLSGGNPLNKPRHRRVNSANSYNSRTIGDDSSMVSMRSNIAKSSLFGGIDEQGRPIMYYPYEAIRLVMVPDPKKKYGGSKGTKNHGGNKLENVNDENTTEEEKHLPLTIGHLYSDGPTNIEDYYEDYHRISNHLEQGATPEWESLDVHPILKGGKGNQLLGVNKPDGICGCQCTNCHTCLGKQDLLPPTNYVVAISDDIYRRMFSEVADAQSMPCGLFFCGHHEDVDYPSIFIPGVLVIILFGGMIYISYRTGFED